MHYNQVNQQLPGTEKMFRKVKHDGKWSDLIYKKMVFCIKKAKTCKSVVYNSGHPLYSVSFNMMIKPQP